MHRSTVDSLVLFGPRGRGGPMASRYAMTSAECTLPGLSGHAMPCGHPDTMDNLLWHRKEHDHHGLSLGGVWECAACARAGYSTYEGTRKGCEKRYRAYMRNLRQRIASGPTRIAALRAELEQSDRRLEELPPGLSKIFR